MLARFAFRSRSRESWGSLRYRTSSFRRGTVGSHLCGAAQELAVEIIRCPILAGCLDEDGYRLACYDAVVGPGGPHVAHWVPDPRVGHLTEAPLLLVSSSTAGGGSPALIPRRSASTRQMTPSWTGPTAVAMRPRCQASQRGNTWWTATESPAGRSGAGSAKPVPKNSFPSPLFPGRDTPFPRWFTAPAPGSSRCGPPCAPTPLCTCPGL